MAFKSNTLFEVLENILKTKSMELYKKHVESDGFKDASAFMIRRYLSMHSNQKVQEMILDNYLNLERMDDKTIYYWCLKNIPKQNMTFIKYLR